MHIKCAHFLVYHLSIKYTLMNGNGKHKVKFFFFPFLNGLAALKDLEPLIYNVITTILQYVGF